MRSLPLTPRAALVAFTALALSLGALGVSPSLAAPPFLEITIPIPTNLNPAGRPPGATYTWQTIPGEPDPVAVRRIMVPIADHGGSWAATEDYIRNNPDAPEWTSWYAYFPPDFGTSATIMTDYGGHVFAIQGRDVNLNTLYEFDLDRNMRRVMVANRSTGPMLFVRANNINLVTTALPDTPPVTISVVPGATVDFCFGADASVYGGIVDTYRYAWNGIPPNWEIPPTTFPGGFGEMCLEPRVITVQDPTYLTIEVVDNDGYPSRATINVLPNAPVPVRVTTWGAVKALYDN